MPHQAHQSYHSFLVRCWLMPAAPGDEPSSWRFELREIGSSAAPRGFSSLAALQAFVMARLAAAGAGAGLDSPP